MRQRRVHGRQILRLPRLRWVVRHPVKYLSTLGFGPFQIVLLPVVAGGVAWLVVLRTYQSA
ncbi:hypothetical protein [Streptomyces endophyticus]|uniref:Uncharacterized protein n=1 Tax=Streptomyces endophyticus TaxID=714166 RepID=A0ABU6F7E9_9ACTN|nr:hypothetical protein [Streptomyces endophyticus]MEB8339769.1 hypothetical protein [Streptomyces endophyticus]